MSDEAEDVVEAPWPAREGSVGNTPALARFVVRARPMGVKPGLDYDRISALIEAVESSLHR